LVAADIRPLARHFGGLRSAVPSDDHAVLVDQDWVDEPKPVQAARDLEDLHF